MLRKSFGLALALLLFPLSASAATNFKLTRTPQGVAPLTAAEDEGCSIEAGTVARIQSTLATVVASADGNGGLFSPNKMWSAVVDRAGRLCSVVKIGDAWPGSRAIAMAKASTANDFSNDKLALSTTMLFAPTQPNGSLWGLNESNPFDPAYLADGTGKGKVAGGIITFGGGVPLYARGKVIGGLGVSGDSSCADHTIAYRMRRLVGLDVIPQGRGGDNISYPTSGQAPTFPQQAHCFTNLDLDPKAI